MRNILIEKDGGNSGNKVIMDILELYSDYSVDALTEGHKHCRPGWVNTPCPWCTGNPGYHLSYNLDGDFYLCWRCGWHATVPTLAKILGLPKNEIERIVKQYGLLVSRKVEVKEKEYNIKPHILPSHSEPLSKNHIRYLEQERGFDATVLQKEYKILGTGPISLLDSLNYKHRIVIPFIWEGHEVSFDSRDITGKHPYKYMACPLEREIIPHKSILYGQQEKWKETGVCVEGPTDVWRFGPRSFATSGIKYTPAQVRRITQIFKRVAVVFDDDPQAIVQAKTLVDELKFRGVDAFRIPIEGDPGSMKQEDANYFVKQIVK